MEQKDFDIYEILKGMPDGTPLYTPLCGNVEFTSVAADKEKAEAIWTEDKNGEYAFDKNGRWMNGGEVLLFPSNEMRDWSKFFKKGDVLVFQGVAMLGICIFEKYEDETLVRFRCRHVSKNWNLYSRQTIFETEDWVKIENPDSYIKFVEERLVGKLNLETLEIEKPAFEIGKLYVFDEQDEDGNITVIGKLIGKDESKGTLTFGTQYEIETENFVTDQTFDLNTCLHKELREATENEAELFSKHYSIWKEKENKAKEQPDFKPFDKVLVRDSESDKWRCAFYSHFEPNGIYHYGTIIGMYAMCIPFEGNEHLVGTTKNP